MDTAQYPLRKHSNAAGKTHDPAKCPHGRSKACQLIRLSIPLRLTEATLKRAAQRAVFREQPFCVTAPSSGRRSRPNS